MRVKRRADSTPCRRPGPNSPARHQGLLKVPSPSGGGFGWGRTPRNVGAGLKPAPTKTDKEGQKEKELLKDPRLAIALTHLPRITIIPSNRLNPAQPGSTGFNPASNQKGEPVSR